MEITISDTHTKKLLSIIIINYNLAEEIDNCLSSLFTVMKDISDLSYEVIIVDNNSPDQAIKNVEQKYTNTNLSFYYSERNLGFGQGCNLGFEKSTGEYICFLNPDTIVKEDIFTPILNLFEVEKSVGIIGPKQQIKGSLFDFSAGYSPNLFYEIFNLFGAGVFLEGFFISLLKIINNKNYLKVNWILGACIFIKADLFREINGFDKDYFMFFEEVDLCKKVLEKKLDVIYYHKQSIHHIGSVSGKKDYRLYTIRTYASKYIFFQKYFSSFNKIIMNSLLYIQLFTQQIIWTVLFFRNREKAKQKLSAFRYLLKNDFKNNIDQNKSNLE